jgi:hypothetical protein
MNELCEEMAQVIFTAGYDLNIEDYGWAFDRAIVNCCMTADEWTEADWKLFDESWQQFKQRGAK